MDDSEALRQAARDFIIAEEEYWLHRTVTGENSATDWPKFARYLNAKAVLVRLAAFQYIKDEISFNKGDRSE